MLTPGDLVRCEDHTNTPPLEVNGQLGLLLRRSSAEDYRPGKAVPNRKCWVVSFVNASAPTVIHEIYLVKV